MIGALILGVLAGGATLAMGQFAFCNGPRAAHPRRRRSHLCRAVRHRWQRHDVRARAYLRVIIRMVARRLCRRGRCSWRRRDLRAHDAFAPPGSFVGAFCLMSGIGSIDDRDQGWVCGCASSSTGSIPVR